MKMKEQQLLEKGYRKYAGEKIDVFDPKRKPWVKPDEKQAKEVAQIIETCPTKALQYILKEQ